MIDTRSTIRESLDLLKPRLHAYVASALRDAYGPAHQAREPRLRDAHLDTQALLSIVLDHWGAVFAKRLRYMDRGLVLELKNARNLWAHEQPVGFDQAYRTLDSVQLLLASIGARDAEDVLERKKAEMRRAQVRMEDESRRPTVSVPASPPPDVPAAQHAEYWAELSRQIDAVFAAHPDLQDHRRAHPWLTGALGDPASRVWFVGENPSLTMVERATSPTGGRPTPEAQWWAGRGDKLLREMLVKHGFKATPPEAPGGWKCYITNAIKEAEYASHWRGSPAERHARAAKVWAPVLAWELAQCRPILVVAFGQTVRRILTHM